ncbi:MAG: type I restriction endonuclease subunit R [Lactobacillus iners]|jgi:type I site-specific deoxyribonuclease, hsdR family|nr:type I restriction endonuclease subunit R [Lactobacillus iners]MCT7725122.1 type I restriction endonuclease subunit R [Lactobacillus iners]MCT7727634.1 type I restriction endonuclease subunit R [Lactobacillus iners]MCT7775299.1 type I restriction endonuclease subunit R [Lactobacillus iners]MCT7812657.1 type I restriction endonuclease subunit R [Lactobacillus iners]
MSGLYKEANYENSIVELFQNMGYHHVYGPKIERDFYSPLYDEELIAALYKLNPSMPDAAIQDALYKLKNFENAELVQKNELFMNYLQNGIEVKYFVNDEECSGLVYLLDYKKPDNNHFVVANQWTFIENSNKRPDVILFLNGLPLVLIELKSPAREETDASEGYLQIRNYMQEIPSMFIYNCICVISDQLISKAGTITSGEDRFMEWKTKDGSYENTQYAQFDTFFEGMFDKVRLLDIIKNFICFSNDGLNKIKILAAYHQYFAVNKAIESTKHATVTDGKGGVFWHTQGSGKSLSMVFYAHLLQEALDSPTIVVITDRNDLDDQLYGQFAKCKDFLRQIPVHATCRKLVETSGKNDIGLKDWLNGRKANGIIFTTMQKFEESSEPLSKRRNIIVMADEAHRSQYGLKERVNAKTGEIKIGTARVIRDSLPNATYIGFTGTPIAAKDRNTREVFGDYIDIYDMTQAVEDGATRPVYYESRVIKLKFDEATLHLIDNEYDIMANNADPEVIEKSKRDLGQMEAILGNDTTIDTLVIDIINHYENYRENLLTGKAMIVAYSREIAMKIYKRMLELRPSWTKKVKVVMTDSNKDPEEWRSVIGNKHHRDELAREFKDNNSEMKIAIVVDMWLTGFDVPSLATMYVYKPMQGYNLMQAIARVNRVFKNKEGGLIVDYVGIASALKQAMNDYTSRDKNNYGDTDIAKIAYPKFLEKLSICRDLFHGYDYSRFIKGYDLERSKAITGGVNFIVGTDKNKKREDFLKESLLLSQALSLCSSLVKRDLRVEAAFFESVRVLVMRLINQGEGNKISLPEMNARINELLKASIKSDGVIDLFSDVKTEFSLFDSKFLEEISKMKEKNLAVELLKKLIAEQVHIYRRTNVVKSEKFSEIIQGVMNKYLNGMLTNEEVIEELLKMAKQIRDAHKAGDQLGLSEDELAFYDALTKPQAIKDFYENDELIAITKELTEALRKNRTIDWQKRESERAKMRMMIKKLLKQHRYPPKGMEDAVQTVMTQCELWTDNTDM